MKVDLNKQPPLVPTAATTAPRAQGAEGAHLIAGIQDRASLTGVASELAAKAVKEVPSEASPARIAALKAAILAGTLRIDPETLAQSMLDHEAPLE